MRPQSAAAFRLRMVTRLAALLTLVMRGQRLPSLETLAERHACSVRTIRRDLEALEAAGWEIRRQEAA